jgi:hypothetical protein
MQHSDENGTIDVSDGMPVWDDGGRDLGVVKDVREHSFKVNAPLQPDFWLRRTAIRAVADGRVVVAHDAIHFNDDEDADLERVED